MREQAGTTTALTVKILLLVLAGTPMIAWLWDVLNRLLSGHVEPIRLLVALPVAALLWFLLRAIARTVERWGDDRPTRTPESTLP